MSADDRLYLITGATGHVGRLVASELRQNRRRVRLLTRSGSRRSPATGNGVELARIESDHGDGVDKPGLYRALEGVAAAFLVCGETPARPQFEMSFIDAAATRRVRVVKLSALGAGPDAPTFLRWHHLAEEHLLHTGKDWTVLRANSLMDNLLRNDRHPIAAGRWRSTLGAAQVSFIAGTDVAAAAAVMLTDDCGAHADTIHELTGPQALTAQDVANLAAETARPPGGGYRHAPR
ncbi:NAD(P)H-binding protein [Microlunatus sp. Gsoil 973]|uniref:NAD(P)H-binding protein n=1 Tax=Microlunatus sp. Gsoil 973 TaxID=2672569 RepID=UPI0012B4B7A1|nr:NAD(P)H-binding protein [Microlunatus sp. Gsoil 973]QGN34351.1 NAD(P)H-binding protein [Microlunatus sp. Gsoil 973]